MVRVLIVDTDLDSHELVDDLVEMIFRDVKIDRVLNLESLQRRIYPDGPDYHLVIINSSMQGDGVADILRHIASVNSSLESRIVFLTSDPGRELIPERFPVLLRPFSLDDFSDMVKKISASAKK